MAAASRNYLLEITVIRCNNLRDTNSRYSHWLPRKLRQDPYVCIEYIGTKCRTKTCHGGHTDPTFGEVLPSFLVKQASPLLNIEVWDKDHLTSDDLIGRGSIQVSDDILSKRPHEITCPLLYEKSDAGEVVLLLKTKPLLCTDTCH